MEVGGDDFGNAFILDACILMQEASSSKTSFYSYNSNLEVNQINGKEKLLINYKIDDYAKRNDAKGYYNIIRSDPIIIDHIINSGCKKFNWALLSTGGMRALEDINSSHVVKRFYNDVKILFESNPRVCLNNVCKDIYLSEVKTITGEKEGYYAWLALKQVIKTDEDYLVFDLGGKTGQLTSKDEVYSAYLGKANIIAGMGSHNVSFCYNHKNKYDGEKCRDNIQSYISENFEGKLPSLINTKATLYGVSNFYHYFNDVCNTYLPYINENDVSINEGLLPKVKELCNLKKNNTAPFALEVKYYRVITDEICQHWSESWTGKKALFAKDSCFIGNYNYLLLKALEVDDNQQMYVSDTDWIRGAVFELSKQ